MDDVSTIIYLKLPWLTGDSHSHDYTLFQKLAIKARAFDLTAHLSANSLNECKEICKSRTINFECCEPVIDNFTGEMRRNYL
jgi:hypothetical protein